MMGNHQLQFSPKEVTSMDKHKKGVYIPEPTYTPHEKGSIPNGTMKDEPRLEDVLKDISKNRKTNNRRKK